MFKFGLYEIFKDYYATLVGPETAVQYRTFVWLAASASAEVFADVALCPFEAVKVKMQTSLPAANFPTTFGPAWARVAKDGGCAGGARAARIGPASARTRPPRASNLPRPPPFPPRRPPARSFFRGLAPLWGRQVPYTMVKFAAFERVIEAFYTYVFTEPKSSYSKTTQLSITFASGYIAGVLCALVSQPADTLVSQMNKNPELGAGALISKLGVSGLYGGLGPRVVMVGTLTGLQWWIYGEVARALQRCARFVACAPPSPTACGHSAAFSSAPPPPSSDSFKTAMGLATAGGAPAVKKA
jgi:solute carrier family 25 phosphate transporter 3